MKIPVLIGPEEKKSVSQLLGCGAWLDQKPNAVSGPEPLEAPDLILSVGC
jgi:hypothetical protein